MNKKIFTFLMVGMSACAVLTSCSKDDGNGDSGAPAAPAGTLAGDDAEANAEVAGLRLTSVGSITYNYDEAGKLVSIDNYDNNGGQLLASNNFKVSESEESGSYTYSGTYTFNIASNHIVSMSGQDRESGDWGSSTSNGTANISYNAKGQIATINISASENGTDDGERYSDTWNTTIVFSYASDNRLKSIISTEKGKEDGESYTYVEKDEFEYSTEYPNIFYQYTPRVAEMIDVVGACKALALVGLYGKASSYLPTGCTETGNEDGEEFGPYHDSFSYSLNEDGTIRRADGYSYSYDHVGTRAIMPFAAAESPVAEQQPVRKTFLRRLHQRHHSK